MIRPVDMSDFSIIYEDIIYKDGVMDIRELAPSLLAFAEIIEDINTFINKKDVILSTKVKSDFQNNQILIEFW